MATETDRSTGRWLIGLTTIALLVATLGVVVVWSFAYGPLA